MAHHAFDSVGAARLCAVCHPENTASARVMQRLGMQYQRMEFRYEMDCAVYGMTRADWDARLQVAPGVQS